MYFSEKLKGSNLKSVRVENVIQFTPFIDINHEKKDQKGAEQKRQKAEEEK